MKLIDSRPNIVAGISYANLKEYLLKIENSGYLDHVIKYADKEVSILYYNKFVIYILQSTIVLNMFNLHNII